jgi:L-malate glycosyltransferase
MRIIFDLRNVGLGNNGGSSTLVKSGNTLSELGHEVFFIDSMKNKHTWTKLKSEHLIIKNENNIPDADAVIATGYKSVFHTSSLPNRCGKKFHWIRGWETWKFPEETIVSRILKTQTKKLVNSFCLQNKLLKFGFESDIVRPGYDFDEIFPMNIRGKTDDIVLGCLYSHRQGQRKRSAWGFEVYRWFETKGYDVKLWMFGVDNENINSTKVTKFYRNPNIEDKNYFYNMVDIWLATSELEGLHIVPAEAMITECAVVGTNAEMSGTSDYLINEKTGLVSENNLEDFLMKVKRLIHNEELRAQYGKNARTKILEIGNRKENMLEMIKVLEK